MSLPETVIFSLKDAQQEVRYLSLTGPQSQLRLGHEEGVFSDTVQFSVEQAGSGLVHFRSRFNNYYWARASRDEPWLAASSEEKVEDISREDCTMFRPQFSLGNVFVSFVHVRSGLNVVMRPATDAHAYNLCVEPAAPADFSFIDYSPFMTTKLPRYIMFLGDNDYYLNEHRGTILFFRTFQTPTDRSVGFEVEYTKSGDIRIKSMRFEGVWGLRDNGQVILYKIQANDPNTWFEVSKSAPPGVGYVGVGLRCRSVNKFCFRNPSLGSQQNLLFGGRDTANTPEACLRPRHAADQNSRKVNIESIRHARFSKSVMFLRRRYLVNTRDVEREHLLVEPTNTLFTRTTFRNSVSYFEGPPAVFSGIPSVATSGELEFPSTAPNLEAHWEKAKFTSANKRLELKVILPAKTRVEVTIYKNVATYEVPFSYQQSDRFPFGGNVTQYLHDGNVRIISEHDIYPTIQHVPIRSTEEIPESAVELVPGSGIFEYEGSAEQDGVETDAPDQEADAIGDMRPDASDQQADALVGNKTDATDQLIPEV